MNYRNLSILLFVATYSLFGAATGEQQDAASGSMKPVSRASLCITEGRLEELPGNRLSLTVPKMRAFVNDPTLQEVEARFTYLGPAKKTAPLASGEIRRQFGLKLRAQDGCNLVYAMWRIKPKAALVVSVKSNPGMTKSSECGAHGYNTITPASNGKLPPIVSGKRYTLRAIIHGNTMRVYANNTLVWEGNLGPQTLAFEGPVGVRSDNGRFEFELFAAYPGPGQRGASAACHAGSGDE